MTHRPHWLAAMLAILLALCGLALVVGGAWLVGLGGSWYYLLAGLVLLGNAWLLWRQRSLALWLFAALFAGTLLWALWESGLDWWPLAARLGLLFVLGALLLLPPVARPMGHAVAGRLVLAVVLGAFVLLAVASWVRDPHTVQGELASTTPATSPGGMAAADWPAYGGTWHGQRFSALAQITPQNVQQLEQAWHYQTGDLRGRPGDPVETTFEVTPLKIGNRLYLCTPHQNVIALDATTGRELWRYDPKIQDQLALQHLTCRGLSWHPGGAGAGPATPAPPPPAAPLATPASGSDPSGQGSPPSAPASSAQSGAPAGALPAAQGRGQPASESVAQAATPAGAPAGSPPGAGAGAQPAPSIDAASPAQGGSPADPAAPANGMPAADRATGTAPPLANPDPAAATPSRPGSAPAAPSNTATAPPTATAASAAPGASTAATAPATAQAGGETPGRTGQSGGSTAPARETMGPRKRGALPLPPPQPPVIAAAVGPTVPSCDARLFMPTADGRVIALDPESGRVCADFGGGTGQIDLWQGMPNYRPGGYYSTSPVVVARDLLVVGGTVLDNVSTEEQSGVIRAFDVRTGQLVWAWDPGHPHRTGPLAPGETYSANSPNSWTIMAADAQLGLVYVPLGNQPPDQWGGNRTPAVEQYSSSLVALDLETGRVRWNFQTVHHDLWDYDVPSQPSLLDLSIGGSTVPALVQPTKQGDLYVLDRRTGHPLIPVSEVPAPQGAIEGDHTAPTQPRSGLSFAPPPLAGRHMWGATLFDQLWCRIAFHRLRYEGMYTPPSEQGTLVYPGNFGVFNWGSIAVDPVRGWAFAAPAYLAFTSKLVRRPNDTELVLGGGPPQGSLPALNENFGAPFAADMKPFTSPLGIPCQQPPWGYVAGIDLASGKVAWQHRNGTVRDQAPIPVPLRMGVPSLGGPVLTAGGVAFLSGTLDYYLRAYDVRTGKELWKARLPAGGQATPMTYEGADGRQYVLVVAGGHGSLGTKAGDDVIAYALPRR